MSNVFSSYCSFLSANIFPKKTLDFHLVMMYNIKVSNFIYAGMAELADAYGSGPYESNFMQVQVLLPAPKEKNPTVVGFFFFW